MRLNFGLMALCLGFVLWLPSSVPQGVPGIAAAQAGSRDGLYTEMPHGCGPEIWPKAHQCGGAAGDQPGQ